MPNRVLTIPLKTKYFDQIKSGEKKFEYRQVKPFWAKRLTGKSYDEIEFTRGYPAKGDEENRLRRPWRGCVIEFITHEEFGDEPVAVFSIPCNEGWENA